MSKPVNKAKIGVFVLGASALAIASLMILGSGKFFSKQLKYEVYFSGSVKGLQIGAPVRFRGVKVGEVTKIALRMNTQDLTWILPVQIEVDPKTFEVVGGQVGGIKTYYYLKPLIAKGLRAQLQMSSFVTGQLEIYLDFFPDSPLKLVMPEGSIPPEIPSVPTEIEELAHKLQELPVQEIADNLNSALTGINRLVNSRQMTDSINSANRLLTRADNLLAQNENLSHQTSQTLEQANGLIRSLNSLSDYLSRHPESIIRGRQPMKGY